MCYWKLQELHFSIGSHFRSTVLLGYLTRESALPQHVLKKPVLPKRTPYDPHESLPSPFIYSFVINDPGSQDCFPNQTTMVTSLFTDVAVLLPKNRKHCSSKPKGRPTKTHGLGSIAGIVSLNVIIYSTRLSMPLW